MTMVGAPKLFGTELTPLQEKLLPFSDGITVFEGIKGSGKTTSAIALAWYLREEFGFPVVCDFPLKTEFGDYQPFDTKVFVQNLRMIAEASKGFDQSVANRQLEELMEAGKMPRIIGSVIILDEAYQYMDSRMPHDRAVRLFGYWISQIRHFQSPLIFMTPAMHMIDKRIRLQVDRVMNCITEQYDNGERMTYASGDDRVLGNPIELEVNAARFQEMFNSWVLQPIRGVMLKAEGEDRGAT